MPTNTSPAKYIEQHKQRLNYMPWLYWKLKAEHLAWAKPWQQEWQQYLQDVETITIEEDCFIASDAKLFAERGRPIHIKRGSFIGSQAVLHGPITIGENVGINQHASFDGGKKGIHIGDNCRIAAHTSMIAFNHQMELGKLIDDQGVTSKGIVIGNDVWLGNHVGITDGVTIGDGAVVGMYSVVTKNVEANLVVAGNPAKVIRARE